MNSGLGAVKERELPLFTLHYLVLYVVETQDELEQKCVLTVLKKTFSCDVMKLAHHKA